MVSSATSYSRNGLRDWLLQRVSAYVLAVYVVFLLLVCCTNPTLDYTQWTQLFHRPSVKLFTLLAILSMGIHAWIGVWTILTDYIKSTGMRLCLEGLVLLVLVSEILWGFLKVWSV